MSTIAQQIKGLKEERATKIQGLENVAKIIETRAFNDDEQKKYNDFKKEISSFITGAVVLWGGR